MKNKMIYLASPYSHSDETIRQYRYEAALAYTAEQLRSGFIVFSPIVYGHQFDKRFSIGQDFESWAAINYWMLGACDEIHILAIDGWDTSKGVAEEIRYANHHEITIRMVQPL